MSRALAGGLVAGVLLDAVLGDPQRGHPVAVFGSAASRVERVLYADSRSAGALHASLLTLAPMTAAAAAGLMLPAGSRAAQVAVATWAVLGARSLGAEAQAVHAHLAAGDLPAARRRLRSLVGRDTRALDCCGISRAVVESVAENACDAVVAPLLWGAAAGVPGLVGHRAVNTLDAMVGHRSPRYARFGWASARLDDLANLVPARLTGALAAALAAVVDGSPRETARITSRFARAHPSPNSGFGEAAFAGALGLRLGGSNVYEGRLDERPVLGDGRDAQPEDIARAVRLLHATTWAALAVAVGLALARPQMLQAAVAAGLALARPRPACAAAGRTGRP